MFVTSVVMEQIPCSTRPCREFNSLIQTEAIQMMA